MDLNNIMNSVSRDLTFPLDKLPSAQEAAVARQALQEFQTSITTIDAQISEENEKLEQLKAIHEATVRSLRDQQAGLQFKVLRARAYLAPIRKLPDELLAEVFLIIFRGGDNKCCWKLSGVCRQWKRVALSLPKLWSSIQLKTNMAACPAECIRLWLERSGTTTPLSIDITLTRAPGSIGAIEKPTSSQRRRPLHSTHTHLPSLWSLTSGHTAHHSLTPPHGVYASSSSNRSEDDSSGSAMAWGYIVFDYLIKQIERWKRFRFVFSAPFPSFKALDDIKGRAPMLEEFTVSNLEGSFYPPQGEQWHWLPSSDPRAISGFKPAPKLRTLELRNVPFRYSSPVLTGLETLRLVSNNIQPMPLNRVVNMLAASPNLRVLELNFAVGGNQLPLFPVTLEELLELKIGSSSNSSSMLQPLIGQLITPSLEILNVETECRTDTSGMAETLNNLLLRSSGAVVKTLTYGSGSTTGPTAGPYSSYHSCFPITVLNNLYHLEELNVCACPMDAILQALSSTQGQQDMDHPDDETDFGGPVYIPQNPPTGNPIFLSSVNSPPGLMSIPGASTSTANGMNAALTNALGTAPHTTLFANIGAAAAAAATAALNNGQNAGNFLAGGVPVMMAPHGPTNNFDDYLCPYLRKITFKHCHPSSESITKLIKMVETRNPDQIGTAVGGVDTSIPRRIKSLEFVECGHIGSDVIDWLEERIENVVYSEASGGSITTVNRINLPFTYSF